MQRLYCLEDCTAKYCEGKDLVEEMPVCLEENCMACQVDPYIDSDCLIHCISDTCIRSKKSLDNVDDFVKCVEKNCADCTSRG